jgi:Phage integrase family
MPHRTRGNRRAAVLPTCPSARGSKTWAQPHSEVLIARCTQLQSVKHTGCEVSFRIFGASWRQPASPLALGRLVRGQTVERTVRPYGVVVDAPGFDLPLRIGQGLRFHDLRHTVITELAEMGVSDHVLESITGHLSRRMLEHYSHIRIDAKRQALDALDMQRGRVLPVTGNGNGANGNGDDAEIEAIVDVSDSVTSQSRHSLLCRARRLPVSC